MKKTTFVYVLASGLMFLMITGYKTGAGTHGWDCTGAETGLGNPAGCASGAGCHATTATSTIAVSLELDSAGVPTTHYSGGMTYTVKLSGVNNGTTVLPKYGLQIGAIKGSVAVTTPVNAGTWGTPFPTTTHYAAPQSGNFTVGVVEQTAAIAAASGTGGTGTTYSRTFNWTAPVTGTGTISFWAVLNAVNNNGSEDTGDKWNKVHIVINEWPLSAGIENNSVSAFDLSVFPNPATENIHLTYMLNKRSKVSVKIFDLNGKIASELLDETQNQGLQKVDAETSGLNAGIYMVLLNVDGERAVKKLIIQNNTGKY
jgi:hypothetical protein